MVIHMDIYIYYCCKFLPNIKLPVDMFERILTNEEIQKKNTLEPELHTTLQALV